MDFVSTDNGADFHQGIFLLLLDYLVLTVGWRLNLRIF